MSDSSCGSVLGPIDPFSPVSEVQVVGSHPDGGRLTRQDFSNGSAYELQARKGARIGNAVELLHLVPEAAVWWTAHHPLEDDKTIYAAYWLAKGV